MDNVVLLLSVKGMYIWKEEKETRDDEVDGLLHVSVWK